MNIPHTTGRKDIHVQLEIRDIEETYPADQRRLICYRKAIQAVDCDCRPTKTSYSYKGLVTEG